MLTNDHNLITKSCANHMRAMTSFDLLLSLPTIISVMDRFIAKDLCILCPQRETILHLTMELLVSAIRAHLVSVNGYLKHSSTADKLMHDIMENAIRAGITGKTILSKTKQLMKEYRAKGEHILLEEVQRFVKYACAILEEIKVDDSIISKTLNVCKGIYISLNKLSKKSPFPHSDHHQKKKEPTLLNSSTIQQGRFMIPFTKQNERKTKAKQKCIKKTKSRMKNVLDVKLRRAQIIKGQVSHEDLDAIQKVESNKQTSITIASSIPHRVHSFTKDVTAETILKCSTRDVQSFPSCSSAVTLSDSGVILEREQICEKSSKDNHGAVCNTGRARYKHLSSTTVATDITPFPKRYAW